MLRGAYGKPWAANKVCGDVSKGLEMGLFLKVIACVTLKWSFSICD